MHKDIVYLNGDFVPRSEAKISVMDRGFLFGDGIYEVIPVYNGNLFKCEQHLDRLFYSLDQIKINTQLTREQWQDIFEKLVAKNGFGNLGLYLEVTRGKSDKRIHHFPQQCEPTIFAMTWELPPPKRISEIPPCKVITTEDIRWGRCDIKSISLLGNVLLSQMASEQGVDEALTIKDGIVTEGASSNLFVIKNNQVKTTPTDHRILGGITRLMLCEMLQQQDVKLEYTDLKLEDIYGADEVWLTSSTKEIRPVVQVNDKAVGRGEPGPLWFETVSHFLKLKQELYYGQG